MLSVVSAGAAAAGMGGMDRGLRGGGRAARELAAARDRQVRLRAVRNDIAVNLPPSIQMPDGEEHTSSSPYPATTRLHLRDPEQESEIYQKCIRPPPNRTVLESESPPPYRSSSAGVLHSSSCSSTGSSDWSSGSGPLVVRCHSMSSSSSSSSSSSTAKSPPYSSGADTNHPHHHHHHHQGTTTHPAQKTDFLQRTVKIFTGSKKSTNTTTQTTTTTTTVSAVPAVVVPTSNLRTAPASTGQNRPNNKPPPTV